MWDAVCTLVDLEFVGCLPPIVTPAGDDGTEDRAGKLDGVDEILIDVADELSESNPFGVDDQAEPAVFAFDLHDHEVVAHQRVERVGYGSATRTEPIDPISVESCGRNATVV
jgi:hypothetical protein